MWSSPQAAGKPSAWSTSSPSFSGPGVCRVVSLAYSHSLQLQLCCAAHFPCIKCAITEELPPLLMGSALVSGVDQDGFWLPLNPHRREIITVFNIPLHVRPKGELFLTYVVTIFLSRKCPASWSQLTLVLSDTKKASSSFSPKIFAIQTNTWVFVMFENPWWKYLFKSQVLSSLIFQFYSILSSK